MIVQNWVATYLSIPIVCTIGLLTAGLNAYSISKIKVNPGIVKKLSEKPDNELKNEREKREKIFKIYKLIMQGAKQFLWAEYKYLGLFLVFFGIIQVLVIGLSTGNWNNAGFTLLCFFLGASASVGSGSIGMLIATFSNARTTIKSRESLEEGFEVAIKGGYVMGFFLSSLIILTMWVLFWILGCYYQKEAYNHSPPEVMEIWQMMFKALAGFGVGASSVALFARVGGGIYTKAADVGADLVGKIQCDIPEDDPRNPAVIADNVGDNVGDIAGMGADLFGSLAGSTCACMVLTSEIEQLFKNDEIRVMPILLPLAVYATGILASVISCLIGTQFFRVTTKDKIKKALQFQELIATGMSAVFLLGTINCFFGGFPESKCKFRTIEINWIGAYLCCLIGLLGGLVVGFATEYYTSYDYYPVQEVSKSCETGTSTNIIYGLALGYNSTVVPAIILSFITIIANFIAGVYGISLATIGVLTTIATSLAIDAYGPICDNAGGIAEMSHLEPEVRNRTDALDADGNTTAAIGKGFAIASACLVGLALLGAFSRIIGDNKENEQFFGWYMKCIEPILLRKEDPSSSSVYPYRKYIGYGSDSRLSHPLVLAGLIIGSMLPYLFSAMTIKSVGSAAKEMVIHVQEQFKNNPGIMDGTAEPDYDSCIKISTISSLKEMILPGALVLLTPLIFGFFFGSQLLMGILAGSIVSGVHMATSCSNTGGAWDNAKKYIEAGHLRG
jgi:inorganic pyrophosphatase